MAGLWRVRFPVLEEAVRSVCAARATAVCPDSVLVGFTAEGALQRTLAALEEGRSCCVTAIRQDHM